MEKVSANLSQGKVGSFLKCQVLQHLLKPSDVVVPRLSFQHASILECSCHIISYLADVMNALRQSSGQGTSALLMEGEEKAMEVDSDWVEELAVEDDDSQAEDSVRSSFSPPEQGCLSNAHHKDSVCHGISKLVY